MSFTDGDSTTTMASFRGSVVEADADAIPNCAGKMVVDESGSEANPAADKLDADAPSGARKGAVDVASWCADSGRDVSVGNAAIDASGTEWPETEQFHSRTPRSSKASVALPRADEGMGGAAE